MDNLVLTAKELANRTGTDYATVQGLLKFLSVRGIAKKTGNAPRSEGKGKGKTALLWSVPPSITLDLTKTLPPIDRTEQVIVKEVISRATASFGPADCLPDGSVGVHQK